MHKQVGHHTKKIEFMWEGGHGPENGSQNGDGKRPVGKHLIVASAIKT